MKGLFKVMPQHLNRIKSKTLIWPLQNLNLFFLIHSEVDLLVCLGSLSCCISALELEDKLTAGPLQDFLIECRIHGFINYGKSSRS